MSADNEEAARAAVRRKAPGMQRSLAKEGSHKWWRKYLALTSLPWLIEVASQGDTDALALIRERGRLARARGESVPQELHAFVWDIFLDGEPRRRPGRSPKDRVLRNQLIANLVKIVSTEFGINPYRAEGKGIRPPSACSIVADELGKVDKSVTEWSVIEVWKDYVANQSEDFPAQFRVGFHGVN